MKKYIFNLFTIKNGIMLNKQTLNFLSSKFTSQFEVEKYFKKFLSFNGSKTPSIEDLQRIIDEDEASIKIMNSKISKRDFMQRINKLKSKVTHNLTNIYLLDDEKSYIFGRYFLDRYGRPAIEDETGKIAIKLEKYQGDAYLTEEMLVCLGGIKNSDVFEVSEIIYPSFDEIRDTKFPYDIFIFNEFNWNQELIYGLIKSTTEGIFIFFKTFTVPQLSRFIEILHKQKSEKNKEHKQVEFNKELNIINFLEKNGHRVLIIPKIEDSPLPIHIFGIKSNNIATNPCVILKNLNNREKLHIGNISNSSNTNASIALIGGDIFKSKSCGNFFGSNHYYCFFKAYLSQYALNAFNNYEMPIENTPNILICATKHSSFGFNIDNSCVIVLNEHKNKFEYARYFQSTGKIEILCVENFDNKIQ